jgi:hypothetical protein
MFSSSLKDTHMGDRITAFPNHLAIQKAQACRISEKNHGDSKSPRKLIHFANDCTRPVVKSKCKRLTNLISQYNRLLRRSVSGRFQAPGHSTEIAEWVSAMLPLSRTDAKELGGPSDGAVLIHSGIWKYGCWHKLCARTANFPVVLTAVRLNLSYHYIRCC